ncbi:hypothetical protein BpHYR1_035388 [Brachionus plicatilis]|uniref:Uncharacterized protein n=1 Tax=Brachionus plicatilis TaxID=10195 RepID=A0A3M7SD18_BRAPC|nr:hypothetical protein BpHYR1_035388 [Brachionus plicatilis]
MRVNLGWHFWEKSFVNKEALFRSLIQKYFFVTRGSGFSMVVWNGSQILSFQPNGFSSYSTI